MHSGKSTDFSIGPSIGPKSLLSPPTCHPREIWTGWYYYILQQTEYLKQSKVETDMESGHIKLFYFYLPRFLFQNKWSNTLTVDPGYIIENSNLAFDWKSVEMTPDLLVNTQICLVFVWEQHHSLS